MGLSPDISLLVVLFSARVQMNAGHHIEYVDNWAFGVSCHPSHVDLLPLVDIAFPGYLRIMILLLTRHCGACGLCYSQVTEVT